MAETETFSFQAEVDEVLSLVIHSLYSNEEIFLRELISNAADALDKLAFRALTEHTLVGAGVSPEIRLIPDAQAHTLAVSDTGIGMSRAELIENLGTIARSGSRAFIAAARQARAEGESEPSLIGRFGVGFYSAFLVADKVEVVSRAAGSDEAWVWSSDARSGFTIRPAERDEHGTTVTLHLKEAHRGLTAEYRLRELVRRYSDFVGHPIKLAVTAASDLRDAQGEALATTRLETINRASALWRRPKASIETHEYEDLYRHLSHGEEPPLAWTHFRLEGAQTFTGILYLPRDAQRLPFASEKRQGIRLYCRRVYVTDASVDLVPEWLRFVRGVVDSDDLDLNVSREVLQRSHVLASIRQQIVRRSLELLEELARDRPDDYRAFFQAHGPVLKEGLHFAPDQRDKLAELVRYPSTRTPSTGGEAWVSLAEYVAAMPDGQKPIYYATGESVAHLRRSPQVEGVVARGAEVLLMADPVDSWAVVGLDSYRDHPLVSVANAELELPPASPENQAAHADLALLCARASAILGDRVERVRPSERLADAPACLVLPAGALPTHLEKLLRAHDEKVPASRRILELNPAHPGMQALAKLVERNAEDPLVTELVEMTYDQARLAEGRDLDDMPAFLGRLARLVTRAAQGTMS